MNLVEPIKYSSGITYKSNKPEQSFLLTIFEITLRVVILYSNFPKGHDSMESNIFDSI